MDPRFASAVPGPEGLQRGIAGGDLTVALTRDGTYTIPSSRWSAVADRGGTAVTSIFITSRPKHAGKMDAEDERRQPDLRFTRTSGVRRQAERIRAQASDL